MPTGVSVVGNYNGPFRSQTHFTPPKNFMSNCELLRGRRVGRVGYIAADFAVNVYVGVEV